MTDYKKSLEEFLLCIAITFAVSVLTFENYLPEKANKIYFAAVALIFAAAWIWFSFVNGRRQNKLFLILLPVFWLIPSICNYLTLHGPKTIKFNLPFLCITDFVNLVVLFPYRFISELIGTNYIVAAVIIALIFICIYLTGFFSTHKSSFTKARD